MLFRSSFLRAPLFAAALLVPMRAAFADSTPPACERRAIDDCEGKDPNSPCDGGLEVHGKCATRPCMGGVDRNRDPVGAISPLQCVPAWTCADVEAEPNFGGACFGKDAGAPCTSVFEPKGGKCRFAECEELHPELGLYTAGRYLSCGPLKPRSESQASDGSEQTSGCAFARSPTTSGSLAVLAIAGTLAALAVRRRRSART